MPCTVKKTFEAARDTGNFLIAQVKANQQILYETLDAICTAEPPTDSAETVERNRHGRQEHRMLETFDVAGRLGADWAGLIVTAARVTRLTWHKNTNLAPNQRDIRLCLPDQIVRDRRGAAIRQHGASKTGATTSASLLLRRSEPHSNQTGHFAGSAPSPSTSPRNGTTMSKRTLHQPSTRSCMSYRWRKKN